MFFDVKQSCYSVGRWERVSCVFDAAHAPTGILPAVSASNNRLRRALTIIKRIWYEHYTHATRLLHRYVGGGGRDGFEICKPIWELCIDTMWSFFKPKNDVYYQAALVKWHSECLAYPSATSYEYNKWCKMIYNHRTLICVHNRLQERRRFYVRLKIFDSSRSRLTILALKRS